MLWINSRKNNTEKLKGVNKKLDSLKGSNNSKIGKVLERTKKQGGGALEKTINKVEEILDNRKMVEIEENFWKELFWVLNSDSSHISVDSEVFKVLEEIWSNIKEIKDDSVLEKRVKNIEFDTNPIKVNGRTIDCTEEPSHLNPANTQHSIKEIEKSDQTLTNLEGIIPELEKRFDKNIEILGKISKEQEFFNGTPRELGEIDENLDEIKSLEKHIWGITTLLSHINDTLQNKNTTSEWTDNPEGNLWGIMDGGNLETDFYDWISNIRSIIQSTKYDYNLQQIPAKYSKITDVNDTDEIDEKQKFYSLRLDKIKERIDELNHEKTLKENIDKLELQKNPITIPRGFLPFWDNETVAKAWNDSGTTDRYIKDFQYRSTRLNNFKKEVKNIHKRYDKNKEKLEKILRLQKFHEQIKSGLREKEIQSIIGICKKLHIWEKSYKPRIQDQVIRIWWNSWKIELNFIDWAVGTNKSIEYSLCDKEWTPFSIDKDNRIITWNNPKICLKWIEFNDDKQTMKIKNLEIDPIESVRFPLKLNLHINVSIKDWNTWLSIEHHKPIFIEIDRPRLEKEERESAYSWFKDTINKNIESKYKEKEIKGIENEAIRKILSEWWNKSKIDKIDKNEKEKFINKIRNRLMIPSLTVATLKKQFEEDMVREERSVPFKYLVSKEKFKEYINDNWEKCLKDYAEAQIYENISKYRDEILSYFSWPQSLSDDYFFNIFTKKSENNNYTKFLVKKSKEFKNINSKISDTKTETFSVKTEVTWVNDITANIEIDGKKDATIIEAKNHDELIERILNLSKMKDGSPLPEKLRCDIALCVLKSMIAMCPKTISRKTQKYSDVADKIEWWNRIKVITDDRTWDLKLRACKINSKSKKNDEEGNIGGSVDIFDEANYKNKYSPEKIKELKKGIWRISSEINIAMNTLAQDYQEAIYGKNRSLLEYNTDGHLKWQDIKKLYWKLRYGGINNDFSFNTKVTDLARKDIEISFNQWKFIVSWEFEWQNYKYESSNLWDILKKKTKDGKRVFDWVELDIINEINEKYVWQLRSNKLIKDKNYIVSDFGENKTWRYYIFDSKWRLSYFEVWNQWTKRFGNVDAGCINFEYIPENKFTCNKNERREFFQNPLLAGKLIREMKKSLWLFGTSKEISESKTKKRNRRKSFKKMSIWNKVRFAWARLKKSTSKQKESPRYSVDSGKISNITRKWAKKIFKIDYHINNEHINYKIRWNLEFTADYLNWKISAKKYLKNLGLSLNGASDEKIKAEADRRAEMYKPYLKDNNS